MKNTTKILAWMLTALFVVFAAGCDSLDSSSYADSSGSSSSIAGTTWATLSSETYKYAGKNYAHIYTIFFDSGGTFTVTDIAIATPVSSGEQEIRGEQEISYAVSGGTWTLNGTTLTMLTDGGSSITATYDGGDTITIGTIDPEVYTRVS